MSDCKIAITDEDDGKIFVKLGDELNDITNSDYLFLVAHNEKDGNNALVISNADKESIEKLMLLVASSILRLKESVNIAENLEKDTKSCENVLRSILKK